MRAQRYPCPDCGRAITAVPLGGQVVCHSLPDEHGRRYAYVYLRRHKSAPGVPCSGWTVRVLGGAA